MRHDDMHSAGKLNFSGCVCVLKVSVGGFKGFSFRVTGNKRLLSEQ